MEARNVKNFNAKYDKNGLLRPESDLLLEVIDHIIEEYPGISKGTFIMQAQTLADSVSYEKPIDVIRFNMGNGEKRHYLGGDRGSDVVASSTLSDASTYSRTMTYGAIRHGYNCPDWMDVETTAGRFIAIFCAEGAHDVVMKKLYLAIAKTLSLLCPEDAVLQNSINTTFRLEFDNAEWAKDLETEIEDIFVNDRFAEVENWKKWHKSQDANSARKEFFS